jgi:hypothetical protein
MNTASLKENFGINKKIPPEYEEIILKALSHYPELKHLHIDFVLSDNYPVPYGTKPVITSLMKHRTKREYRITLLDQAEPPMLHALFKNLPKAGKLAVLGHEIAHVAQYNTCSSATLLRLPLLMTIPAFLQQFERDADRLCIAHGFGAELYFHAVFIRNIPGYVKERKNLNRNYLKPNEILQVLKRKLAWS